MQTKKIIWTVGAVAAVAALSYGIYYMYKKKKPTPAPVPVPPNQLGCNTDANCPEGSECVDRQCVEKKTA
jgi:uncharacterized membrane protein YebE (DUF533 family)